MKKTLAKTLIPAAPIAIPAAAPRRTTRLRVGGALTLLAVTAAVTLGVSRPAHTAGGPIPVTVSNAPLLTTSTDSGARQPFAETVRFDKYGFGSFRVPEGKRLVIQQVSAISGSQTVQHITLFSTATVSGTSEDVTVPFSTRNRY